MNAIDQLRQSRNRLEWSKIDPDNPAILHQPKRFGDIGWDLEVAEDIWIGPGEAVDVPTNVRMALPVGVWAEIKARSSVVRRGLMVDAGIIDNGYRGPLFVVTRNVGELRPDLEPMDRQGIQLKVGERVAQLIFHRIAPVWPVEVAEVSADTERGEGGFGSTGI